MKRGAEILNELEELQSPLAALPWKTPFAVPDGYLASLAETLAADARFDLEEPVLSIFSKEVPFELPGNYFSGLAGALSEHAMRSDIVEHAIPYETPAGYFETLPGTLLQQVQLEKKRSKRMDLRPHWRSIARFAAAAVLVLGISFGAYRHLHPQGPELMAARQLSKVDANVIDSYVEQHLDDFDSESLENAVATSAMDVPAINSLDASEIRAYLQEDGELGPDAGSQTL